MVVGDVQPLVRLSVTCIAEDGGSRQQGTSGGGGRHAFEFFLEGDRYLRFTREAAPSRRCATSRRATRRPAR